MAEEIYLPSTAVLERAALSSAMHHPELLLQFPHDPACYHLAGHRLIYETMRSLAQAGRPVDMPTLYYALGEPEAHPDYAYLSGLSGEYPDWRAYDYYVSQLQGYLTRRQVILLAEEAGKRAQSNGVDAEPSELLSWLRTRVAGLSGATLGFKHPMEGAERDAEPLSTGFASLDAKLLGGPRGGELVVVMGRPGTGKTSAMLSSALRQARQGLRVGIFSLEMSHRELTLRMLSILSGVSFEILRLARDQSLLPGPERQALEEARERLREYKIEVDDQAGLSLPDLENRAYQLKAARGLDVLWVDNMPLVATKEETDYRSMSLVSWKMKVLAKSLVIPVFGLHQLSRYIERRDDHRPRLSDLADSGKIEANADTVLGLYRPWIYDHRESPNVAELHVLKQRNGPIGMVPMMFLGSSMEYREAA